MKELDWIILFTLIAAIANGYYAIYTDNWLTPLNKIGFIVSVFLLILLLL